MMRRWWRRPQRVLFVALAGAALLAGSAATASAQPDPPPYILPPAPGVTPGADWAPGVSLPDLVYTATDGSVWQQEELATLAVPYQSGRLVGPPAPVWTSASRLVTFGRGTDNHLWYEISIPQYASPWYPLGGGLTSKPGVASLGGGAYAVFVRGTDGAVWERVYNGTKWANWTRIGGQSTANPALTAISSTMLAAFCRGTNGAGFYTRYPAAGAAGWRSMGGKLSTGVTAVTGTVNGKVTTYTFGLGTNSAIYGNTGTWSSYPPSLSGWKGY